MARTQPTPAPQYQDQSRAWSSRDTDVDRERRPRRNRSHDPDLDSQRHTVPSSYPGRCHNETFTMYNGTFTGCANIGGYNNTINGGIFVDSATVHPTIRPSPSNRPSLAQSPKSSPSPRPSSTRPSPPREKFPLRRRSYSLPRAASPRRNPKQFREVNHGIRIRRDHESIEEDFAVPPRANVSMQQRSWNNLTLETNSGWIDSSVTIDPYPSSPLPPDSDFQRKVMLSSRTTSGAHSSTIHAGSARNRPSFYLSLRADSGSVVLRVPHTFNGPIRLQKGSGSTSFSDILSGKLSVIKSEPGRSDYFLGHVEDWFARQGDGWDGDEVCVQMGSGTFILSYDDEGPSAGRNPPLGAGGYYPGTSDWNTGFGASTNMPETRIVFTSSNGSTTVFSGGTFVGNGSFCGPGLFVANEACYYF